MNQKILILSLCICLWSVASKAQDREELEAQKAEKQAQVNDLQSQIDALKGEITTINTQLVILPRWEKGILGTVGVNFNGFNQWLSRDQPNVSSSNIALSTNAFANHFTEKDFWRNSININMGWVQFNDRDDITDDPGYNQSADAINIRSLYGYKFSEQFAVSTLGEYRSTLLSNFNNPGYLDVGVGATWTPITDLVVVIHPINYNFIFSEDEFDFESSLGAKLVADYTREIITGLNWNSNLSVFLSYKSESLSNATWINSLAFTVWKGIGVGLEFGLRDNEQEFDRRSTLLQQRREENPGDPNIPNTPDGNPIQLYYVLGLSYSISAKK